MSSKLDYNFRPLGKRIGTMRYDHGMTIAQAAEAAEVSRSDWAYIEYLRTNAPPVQVLRRVLAAVGCDDPDEVLKGEGLL